MFIVNPISGYSNKIDIHSLLKENLDLGKFDFEYKETECKGHGSELAAQAILDGLDIVVACGGDGTVNEVARPLVNSKVTMGIIPNGSGNGFAMHIGMGRNIKKAILKINDAEPVTIDTCTVNGEFFLNLAGVGFDALIAYKIDNSQKRGLPMYATTVTKEVFRFTPEEFKIITDTGSQTGKYSVVAVANSAMYGYNFTIAPQAKLADGLLDVVLIKDASILRTVLSSWRMLNNSIQKSNLVEVMQSKEVRISLDKPYYYHIDGESFEFDNELHFKIVPQSLHILMPTESKSLL